MKKKQKMIARSSIGIFSLVISTVLFAVLPSSASAFQIAVDPGGYNGRYSVASGCVGTIQGCIDACTTYVKERKAFGKVIGEFQLVQDMIAKMVVDRDAGRLLVYRTGELKNKKVRNTVETSIAKYFCTEAALRAAHDAIQIHGGYGYCDDYPVERYYRDARVATIYEGTSQIQKLIIAENILGLKAFA